MTDMRTLTYVGPIDEVEIAGTGLTCKQGGTVDVPAKLAGYAPHTYLDRDDDGNEVELEDPGEGLLAQPSNWQLAEAGVKPLDAMTLDELKAYADEHEVELGDATKKADILAAIKDKE